MKTALRLLALSIILLCVSGSAIAQDLPIGPMRALPLENRAPLIDLPYNPSHLMVKFKTDIPDAEYDALLQEIGGWQEWDYYQINWELIRFDMGISYDEMKTYVQARDIHNIQRLLDIAMNNCEAKAERLRRSPWVEKVEFDWFVELFDLDYTPNDPFFVDVDPVAGYEQPQQWTMFDVQLPEAWDVTTGSDEIIIAIIDSGTDTDHPDLEDNIARWPSGAVKGKDYVGGKDGELLEIFLPVQIDNNPDIHHNDGVDDGWGLPDPSAGDGQDVFGLASSQCDLGVFHGTWTASCASAVTDNALGGAGAGFNVKIMPVRCISPEGGLIESMWASVSVLTMGVNWAVDNGADIISMSLGLPANLTPAGLHDAVINAYNQGVAVFAASGNSGQQEQYVPASWDETFAVGSFSQSHERADFSTYGNYMDCLAGGGQIIGSNYSTAEWIWGCYVASVCDENNGGPPAGSHGFVGALGTSAACPQAAGIAGLLLSVNPNLTPDQLYDVIRSTCLDVEAPGWDVESGYGIIQARAALDALSGASDLVVTLTPQGSTTIPPSGGTLMYNVEIANQGTAPAFVDFWEDITLPSGSTYGPVLLRSGLTLQPGQSITRDLSQAVPAGAPAGNYTFNAYLGSYPNVIDAEDHFNFSKSGVDGSGSMDGWIASGWLDELQTDATALPQTLRLYQNYPNPFNPETTLRYDLPAPGHVTLTVYDLSGRSIARLVDGYQFAGTHTLQFDGSDLASGVYIYRLTASGSTVSGKMVLMK